MGEFLIDAYFKKRLSQRVEEHAFRSLRGMNKDLIDFSSNDYLGFARSGELLERMKHLNYDRYLKIIGSTGSRLLTGNIPLFEELEQYIARFHRSESSLIFNSGYVANIGLLSCVASRGDTILYDELCHASLRDGSRVGFASAYKFKHNDLVNLNDRLAKAEGNIFVVVESLYSMDGELAPLQEIVALCQQYKAHLIVDEAHSIGLYGKRGEGLCVELGLHKEVFARVVTFGKALGSHGAAVLGNATLREYLINFSRPFIYTTALPLHSLISILSSYNMLFEAGDKIAHIKDLSKKFKNHLLDLGLKEHTISSDSQIQSVVVQGNQKARESSEFLATKGFDVRPILSPSVQEGKERLRICIHAFNTEAEIKNLGLALKECLL